MEKLPQDNTNNSESLEKTALEDLENARKGFTNVLDEIRKKEDELEKETSKKMKYEIEKQIDQLHIKLSDRTKILEKITEKAESIVFEANSGGDVTEAALENSENIPTSHDQEKSTGKLLWDGKNVIKEDQFGRRNPVSQKDLEHQKAKDLYKKVTTQKKPTGKLTNVDDVDALVTSMENTVKAAEDLETQKRINGIRNQIQQLKLDLIEKENLLKTSRKDLQPALEQERADIENQIKSLEKEIESISTRDAKDKKAFEKTDEDPSKEVYFDGETKEGFNEKAKSYLDQEKSLSEQEDPAGPADLTPDQINAATDIARKIRANQEKENSNDNTGDLGTQYLDLQNQINGIEEEIDALVGDDGKLTDTEKWKQLKSKRAVLEEQRDDIAHVLDEIAAQNNSQDNQAAPDKEKEAVLTDDQKGAATDIARKIRANQEKDITSAEQEIRARAAAKEDKFDDRNENEGRSLSSDDIETISNALDGFDEDQPQQESVSKNSTPPDVYQMASILEKRLEGHGKQLDILKAQAEKGEDTKNAILIKAEAMRILEKRISQNKNAIFEFETDKDSSLKKFRKRFRHNLKKIKTWYSKPENKKELHRRVLWSAGVAAGITVGISTGGIGLAASAVGSNFIGTYLAGLAAKTGWAVAGSGLLRFGGSYAGGEITRNLYLSSKKDYRQKMADYRARYKGVMPKVGNNSENLRTNSKFVEYRKGLLGMDTESAKYIKKKNRWTKIWDRIGRVAGGASATAVESAFTDLPDVIPEDVPEGDITPEPKPPVEPTPIEPEPDPQPVPPEGKEFIIPKDAYVGKGDGITWILKRQLDINPELAEKFGVPNGTPEEYAQMAEKFGVMNGGKEVRLLLDPESAYVPSLDDQGQPIIQQFKDGELVDTYCLTDNFEGSDIQSTEYLEDRGVGYRTSAVENTSGNVELENANHSTIAQENSVQTNPNDLSEGPFNKKMQPENLFDASDEGVDGPESIDASYHGSLEITDFSDRAKSLINDGKYSIPVDTERLSNVPPDLKGVRILHLGGTKEFVLETTSVDPNSASAEVNGRNKIFEILQTHLGLKENSLGFSNSHSYNYKGDSQIFENKTFVKLSHEQAEYLIDLIKK